MLRLPMLALFALVSIGCKVERQPAGEPFSDDFERAELGPNWKSTGANFRIVAGELVVDRGFNHPLWLTKPIPRDAVIELDAWSASDVGDIKFEAWGDGKSFAQTVSYTATSYVFILGGWKNSLAAIARMDEHANDRKIRSDLKVEKGKHYHFKVTRSAGKITWEVDGVPFLAFDDPNPLLGPDHAYFGFNDWEAELHFDNLKIRPL
jgi:hypothetical protein